MEEPEQDREQGLEPEPGREREPGHDAEPGHDEEPREPGNESRRSAAGTAGLLSIAFFGTLVVLLGLVLGVRGLPPPGDAGAASPSSGAVVSLDPGAGATSPPQQTSSATQAPVGSASGDPVLVGAGDIATCGFDGDEATARLLDGIPGTVFTAGDNAYDDGSAQNFAECYSQSWGRHRDRTRPAAGNHDWITDNAQGYRDYYGLAALNADGDTWYSYGLGAWHVIVLDSNCDKVGGCGPDSRQGRWLAADLAANEAFCTVAIWHHPRFSSGDEHGNDPSMDPFWRALYAAGVDVVVNGHDHDYERFAPQDPNGAEDRARGIREFVVGTGGTPLRGFNTPEPNSELRLAVTQGVLKLTLHERAYDWSWIPTTDTVSDTGFAACH